MIPRSSCSRRARAKERIRPEPRGSGSMLEHETPWTGGAPPAAWYQFSTARGAKHPSKHLETYAGFANADAYARYNGAYRTGRVKEMACPLGSMLRMRLSGNILRMCGVSSLSFIKAPSCPWRAKPSCTFESSMTLRRKRGVCRLQSAWPCVRRPPSRFLTTSKSGSKSNWAKSAARHR